MHVTRRSVSVILRSLGGLVASCLLLTVLAHATQADFSEGWRFHLGDASGSQEKTYDDRGWDVVALPHTARLEALVTNKTDKRQWEGVCWYRKTFTLPAAAAGQVVWLRFEGAMNRAELFVNGEKVGENVDGYLPLVADISRWAGTPGPLTVAVRLDNHATAVTGPKPLDSLDFHLYHGLYRTASLVIKPPLHITDEILANQPASGGVFVTYPKVSDTAATVDVKVHARNAATSPAEFLVTTILRDRTGHELARAEGSKQQLASGASGQFGVQLEVNQPRLWSPQDPNLSDLEIALVDAHGVTIDTQLVRIGIRRVTLEPGGVVINGRKLFLNGTNRHQEHPYVGNAVPANAQYRDAVRIKSAGLDFVRLSHYPPSPEFLAACDEIGLVVMDSILGWQWDNGTPAFHANRIEATRQQIRRDRNHPSVILWEASLNETDMAKDFIRDLHTTVHAEYPGDQAYSIGWMHGYDVYVAARQHGSTAEFKATTFPSIVSEYGDWEYYAGNGGFNQENWGELKAAERNSRQVRGDGEVRQLQQALNFQQAHNENRGTRAMGDASWVMFDYNRGYADDLETSGMMDIFRLPKFTYYFYQSQRDPAETRFGGPMVYAATWWTEASPLSVRVFSNGEEVELSLNGRSLGRQRPDRNQFTTSLAHPPFTFVLPRFEPGELKAVAYIGGMVVAEHIVRTPGPAKKVDVVIDFSGRSVGGRGDLAFARARILDATGTVVPTASLPITFKLEGDATLIGDNPIAAEAGIATILVKTGDKDGVFTLKASTPSLD